ncbi:MAG: 23S rRNA (guanosine(2251)-2'-O)-methyltransferase RlmB [Ruminococcaceae bacterium]|nr:23S rRNA (guanosine(2251)-2'-O)-methyltransferase RlmB [Oscillospiraceae bacterium]
METKKNQEKTTIEGRNAVYEALAAGRTLDKIFISETVRTGGVKKLCELAREKGVPVQMVKPQRINSLQQTEASQGVVAVCSAARYAHLDDLFQKAAAKGRPPFIIMADEITDPHNLGAIIRSANAAGADGVIIPKNRAAGLDAVAMKTSAGAAHYTPVVRVTNLVQTAEELKERGVWLAGADMAGEKSLYDWDLTGPIALVIGSEGKGISRLLKEKCDFLLKIPMLGEIESLNASVAAAVMMYEVVRQRKE